MATEEAAIADPDPGPPRGWRRARPWERGRAVLTLRRHPAVMEVLERTSWVRWSWRHAEVRLTTRPERMASLVVPADSARLYVFARDTGVPTVVGYTCKGVYVPRSR